MSPVKFIGAVWLALASGSAIAQPVFDEVTPSANPYFATPEEDDFWVNAVAPADVDGDGDLDLAVLGFYVVYNVSAEDRLVMLLNEGEDADGEWTFTPQTIPLGDAVAGASDLAWGDFDGDGNDDLVLGSEGVTVIYRNDGGTLAALGNELPGYYEDSKFTIAYDQRSLAWADTDNDGDLDLLVPSVFDFGTFQFRTALVRNDGSDGLGGWLFTEVFDSGLDATSNAQSAWGDWDGDSDLDLMLVNIDQFNENGFIRRYDNDGGTFTSVPLLDIRIEHGMADWGDHDGDGDYDVLVAGNILDSDKQYRTVLRTYKNEAGTLTSATLLELPNAEWLDLLAATWADYDSDGDVDLLITGSYVGEVKIEGKSDIYVNDGGGGFTPLQLDLPAPVDPIGRGGTFTWFDVDGDGDLDYLVAGAYDVSGGNGLVEAQMHLYRNATAAANAAPSAPLDLNTVATADGAVLSWTPPADDHTPAAQLTYDLEISSPGMPTAKPRRLPEPGSIGNATSWTLAGLPEGHYAWRIRAVDSSYTGGSPASGTFRVGDDGIFANGFEQPPP